MVLGVSTQKVPNGQDATSDATYLVSLWDVLQIQRACIRITMLREGKPPVAVHVMTYHPREDLSIYFNYSFIQDEEI
jgi:hypothetical protein